MILKFISLDKQLEERQDLQKYFAQLHLSETRILAKSC